MVLWRLTRPENQGERKKKKWFAMREKFDNTASRILGNHRDVLCVSGDVYEAKVCWVNIIIIFNIPFLDLS